MILKKKNQKKKIKKKIKKKLKIVDSEPKESEV